MSLLGRWFVKVEVDKSTVKRDLSVVRTEVAKSAAAIQGDVARMTQQLSPRSLSGNRGNFIANASGLMRSYNRETAVATVTTAKLTREIQNSSTTVRALAGSLNGLSASRIMSIGGAFGATAAAIAAATVAAVKFSKAMGTDYQQTLIDPLKNFQKRTATTWLDILGGSVFGGPWTTTGLLDPIQRGSKIAADPAVRGQLNSLRLERAEMTQNRELIAQLNREKDTLLAIELRSKKIKKEYVDQIVAETKATRDLKESIELQTQTLQQNQQIAELTKRFAEMSGDASGMREAAEQIDAISLSMLRLQNVPPDVIAKISKLLSDVRALNEQRRSAAAWNAKADLGLQILDLSGDADIAGQARAREAHRLRVQQFEQMALTDDERSELVIQSHELMLEELRQLDIEYGRDWRGLLERMLVEHGTFSQNLVIATENSVNLMVGLFSDVFFDVLQGNLDDLDEHFKNFFKSIAREIANLLAKQAAAAIIKAAFGTTILGAANGGILPGGFRAFASGGIVNQPTLGLVGEGKYNEAIVPLPDGKSIPVQMQGGEQVVKVTNVIVTDPRQYQTGPDEIRNVLLADALTNGPVTQEIRRRVRR